MEKIKILVIDDEPAILETVSLLFESEPDFEVKTLRNVALWRETILAFRPRVLLVDYRMPAMSGDLLIHSIYQSGLRDTIDLIGLFSATLIPKAEVQKIGADLFLEKPFDVGSMAETIRSTIHRHESRAA